MCTINSQKITVAFKFSQQTTIKISCHLTMYNILYKNDKLEMPILVKIVNPIEKCQTTDYISLLASYQCQTTVQNFAYQYVTQFYPYKFSLENTIYYQINRKTLINSNLQQVYYFSQLERVNTKPTKLESQFYEFSSSRYLFYKFTNIQKAFI